MKSVPWAALVVVSLAALATTDTASAQLKGHYLPGFSGLDNGSLAPAGLTLSAPWYFYTTNRIQDDDGNTLAANPRVSMSFTALALSWASNIKIGGARWGASIVPVAFVKSRIEANNLDAGGSFAFTDIELDPIQLGWESAQADFVFNYALFIPTGKWDLGGTDNSGLGMWSNLFQTGTTVRLDGAGEWTFSMLVSYETHSKKGDTEIQVGDIATFEGGLGKTFVKSTTIGNNSIPTRIVKIGVVSYGQLKMTEDNAGPITPLLGKDRILAIGGEGNLVLPLSGWVVGLRLEPEFGARNRTEGWMSLFTIAYRLR